MPRVHKHTARQDIWRVGVEVKDTKTKSGFRNDRSRPSPNKADEDEKLVEKGQTYYTWKFRFGGAHYSLTPPTPRQLTQSGYAHSIFDIQDQIDDLSSCGCPEDLQSARDDIVSTINELRDEQEASLQNMPEHLQESSESGQLLQERMDALENASSEFENVDLDYDEPDDETVLAYMADADPATADLAKPEDIEKSRQSMGEEWVAERSEELQGISIEG